MRSNIVGMNYGFLSLQTHARAEIQKCLYKKAHHTWLQWPMATISLRGTVALGGVVLPRLEKAFTVQNPFIFIPFSEAQVATKKSWNDHKRSDQTELGM